MVFSTIMQSCESSRLTPPIGNLFAVKLPSSCGTTLTAQGRLLGSTKSVPPWDLPLWVLFALFQRLVALFLLPFAEEEAGVQLIFARQSLGSSLCSLH